MLHLRFIWRAPTSRTHIAMTSKIITLAASAVLIALSSAADAHTANVVPPRHHAAQASREAFDFAAPSPAAQLDTYHYHGGPKSDATR
jgi:hypothetical protein